MSEIAEDLKFRMFQSLLDQFGEADTQAFLNAYLIETLREAAELEEPVA